MKKIILILMLASAIGVTVADPLIMNCTNMHAGEYLKSDFPLTIDYVNQQVNGFPATFATTTISFAFPDGIVTVNRLSGNIDAMSKPHNGFVVHIIGTCSPAKAQF
jgi:hypothetical protein